MQDPILILTTSSGHLPCQYRQRGAVGGDRCAINLESDDSSYCRSAPSRLVTVVRLIWLLATVWADRFCLDCTCQSAWARHPDRLLPPQLQDRPERQESFYSRLLQQR